RSLASGGALAVAEAATPGRIAPLTDAPGESAGKLPVASTAMDTEHAIRTRRTVKAFDPEPVDRPTLDDLLELARWAPNHHLTNPWRFRVVGPAALERLKATAGALAAADCPEGAEAAEVARAAAAKL